MKKIGQIAALVFLIFLAVAALTVAGGYYWLNQPPSGFRQEKIIKIPERTGINGIAVIMRREGVIKSEFFFKVIAFTSEHGLSLKPGEYKFKPGMTTKDIVAMLASGPQTGPQPKFEIVKVVIPEGFTAEKIAERLESQLGLKPDKVLDVIRNPGRYPEIEPPFANMSTLEGCLFPATYPFKTTDTEVDAIEYMVRKFREVLPPDFTSKARGLGLKPYEAVIVASLIEREAKIPQDRDLISAVIFNRLKKGMKLQIDATVQYAKGDWGPVKPEEYNSVNHPFNTYLHDGLPPHAIAEPGLSALNAAVDPASVDYLFYVTKDDGSNGHYFATTEREHNANKIKRGNNRRGGQ